MSDKQILSLIPVHPVLAELLEQAQPLYWSTFNLRLRALEPCQLPGYLGSALRGVFGHAFKDSVCLVRHGDCSNCLLRERCPYPYVFETFRPEGAAWMTRYDNVPHPYLLLPPPPGKERACQTDDTLTFGFRLFGPASELLAYFILAWEEMGKRGLGAGRHPFALEEVSHLPESGPSTPIYVPGGQLTGKPSDWISHFVAEPVSEAAQLTLQIETPLRLSQDGHELIDDLPFEKLIASLLRRLSMVLYFHQRIQIEGDFAAVTQAAAKVPMLEQSLGYRELPRWSNRQQRKMNMGGLMGQITYGPEALAFWPLLRLGQVLLAGKSTSFGMGRYRIRLGA